MFCVLMYLYIIKFYIILNTWHQICLDHRHLLYKQVPKMYPPFSKIYSIGSEEYNITNI